MFTRGIWIFDLSGNGEEDICKTIRRFFIRYKFSAISEYLFELGKNRYVLISKLLNMQLIDDGCWIREVHEIEPKICGYFGHICEYHLIFLSDKEGEYLDKLEQLRKSYAKNMRVYLLNPHKTLLLCDLGDVVWDECGAQKHMMEIAKTTLRLCGYDVSDHKWYQTYRYIAATEYGERFYRCVEELSDTATTVIVKKAIADDFQIMSDQQYMEYHPLRPDFYKDFLKLQNICNICFVANQPVKAYTLLREYKIGLITPLWFLSCEYGIKKPDTAIFSECLQQIKNVGFKHVYMCGNRKDMDLIPAGKVGINGILYLCDRSTIKEQALHKEYIPDVCVRNFRELYEFMREWEET